MNSEKDKNLRYWWELFGMFATKNGKFRDPEDGRSHERESVRAHEKQMRALRGFLHEAHIRELVEGTRHVEVAHRRVGCKTDQRPRKARNTLV